MFSLKYVLNRLREPEVPSTSNAMGALELEIGNPSSKEKELENGNPSSKEKELKSTFTEGKATP